MNVLVIDKISKIYGEKTLFDKVSLGVNEGDKIGLIGVNGTGKSTFLKIIAGITTPDEGTVTKNNDADIAYLPQNPEFEEGDTILQYVIRGKKSSNEHWSVEGEAKTILTKLNVFEYDKVIDNMSGGERKRIALARALVSPAKILIMDEPTNHLDSGMVMWLEQYLKKFKGVLLMVTHDRYFLDRVTNKIVEIDNANLYSYDANYSGFLELRQQRIDSEIATNRKRESILRTEVEWVRRGAQARSTKQKARLERYEEMKNEKGPREEKAAQIDSVASRLGKKTIEIENISKSYGDKCLIKDFTYYTIRNERIGIVGHNGCGKSTLLKIILGIEEPDSGSVVIGETIKIGYFAQECEDMDGNERVIDYIRNIAEYIETTSGKASASQMLERFLFTPVMQYTPINKLSGGEKRRLYLLKVLMAAPNVLILDEPTNDLDIATLTILEDYLDSFSGIVITVSHDRYFLDRIVDRIFTFEENGKVTQYEGGYSDYLEKSDGKALSNMIINNDGQVIASKSKEVQENVVNKISSKETWKKKEDKLKFSYKEQKEYDSIDDDISNIETRIAQMDEEMSKVASEYFKLNELMEEKTKLEEQLEYKMDRWVYLNDLAEQIANQ